MARIRIVEISNFRAIKQLRWLPNPGINCLIGPGDSGKSSILEAIDYCLGARRTISFDDTDFYRLDTTSPVVVSLTLGDLDDSVRSLDSYGQFLRGFNKATGDIEDEPAAGLETVVTLKLNVGADLDPQWTLFSERAASAGMSRNLTLGDRQKMAPVRIGSYGDSQLSWRRGSILHRLSDETFEVSEALAAASRDARAAFGDHAEKQLKNTLDIITSTAKAAGINIGAAAKALLDAQAVSFVGGSISVHDGDGVPLSGLGVGSTRMLLAALQRHVASDTGIILLDELEHGLEPHRIIRLVGLLGAKEIEPKQQAFVTTHSPSALREFSADQLFVVRRSASEISVTGVASKANMQGTIRTYPEAFLAHSVLVCEGASEVGFLRGINRKVISSGKPGLEARGVALVDGNGSNPQVLLGKAGLFLQLGYRTAAFIDSDVDLDEEAEKRFVDAGGSVVRWSNSAALEDALFSELPDKAITLLIDRAIEIHDENLVNSHITSTSNGQVKLADVRLEGAKNGYSTATRQLLGKSAKAKKKGGKSSGWFKTISHMEDLTFDIVVPYHTQWGPHLKDTVEVLWKWINSD